MPENVIWTGNNISGTQFSSLIQVLSQQTTARIATNVRSETMSKAQEIYFHQLAPDSEPVKKTERYGLTPYNEADLRRRRLIPDEWQKGTRFDIHDLARYTTVDPQNDILKNQLASLNRKKDSLLIDAAFGSAWTGEKGTIEVPFKDETVSINGDGSATTQGTLAVDGTLTAITLAKMALMLELFNNDNVDPVIPKYWCMSPKDVADLLQIATMTSKDYVESVNAVQSGKIEYRVGFNLFWLAPIEAENGILPKTTTGGLCRRNLVWAKDGLIICYLSDVSTTVDRLPEHQNNIQIFSRMDLGALRFEGKKVRECLNKIAA